MGELEDTRKEMLLHFMAQAVLVVEQLTKTMFLDYQLLTVTIHVNTFGLKLVVVVKDITIFITVLAPYMERMILLLLLIATIIVSQVQNMEVIIMIATYYFNDPLWDGAGCTDNYCDDIYYIAMVLSSAKLDHTR